MKPVNIALVGAGFIADYHARGLIAQPNVEIVSVCGLGVDAIKAFAAKYGVTDITEDAISLAARADIDAVVIGTPNKFHAPYAIEFMKRGKDVFLEKPMAMNALEGEQIARISAETGKLVMVGHMWRFDTEVDYIKKVIESGQLGKIIKTKGYGIHENWGPEGWFAEKKLAGGGALADMGVHAIYAVRYMLGDPQPKQVYAKIGTYFGNYDVDDTGIIVITWETGATSIIECGWWQPHKDGPSASTQIFGTQGYANLFPTMLKFKVGEYPGEFKAQVPEKAEHADQIIYTRQMEHFIECIRNRKAPNPGLDEGITIMKIVDAAYQSAESGQAVDL